MRNGRGTSGSAGAQAQGPCAMEYGGNSDGQGRRARGRWCHTALNVTLLAVNSSHTLHINELNVRWDSFIDVDFESFKSSMY